MLEKQCNLIYPKLPYGNVKGSDDIYRSVCDIINDNQGKIDLIIGHSMGGYLAYYLAKEFNIPALVINPAFDDKEYYIYVTDVVKPYTPKIFAVVGLQDDVISPEVMLKYLEETKNCEVWKEQEMGHDISLDMLENSVRFALRENHIVESVDTSLIKVIRWAKEKIPANQLIHQKMNWGGFNATALSFTPYTDLNDPRINYWKNQLEEYHKIPMIENHYYLDCINFPYKNEDELTKFARKTYGYNNASEAIMEMKKLKIHLTLARIYNSEYKYLNSVVNATSKDKLVEIRLYPGCNITILDNL
jgi:hypothetical protein